MEKKDLLRVKKLLTEKNKRKHLSEVEAELRQVRDSYQLHQDELQNERISRQNRDRELEDKQAQLEVQRRLLEEERLRGTGLEEELRQLRLELAEERESRLAAEREVQIERISRQNSDRELEDKQAQLEEQRRLLEEERLRGTGLEEELRQLRLEMAEERESRQEIQIDRNRLQKECNSRARELESYNHRLRESERIALKYKQLLSEETQLKSKVEAELQEKEALVVVLQQLLNEETQLKSEVEAELRQVRDSYQLHQDELQNERISRQNRDRELEDKQAQLEVQRRQLEEERLRGTGLEEELCKLRHEFDEEKESRLGALDEIQELRSELTAAQQSLDEYRSQQPPDWIIGQDEVTITGKILGGGAWGNVVEGKFRGCEVAVKRIHELILSPQNRRLFEREMNIASRCRHPCLLQFIGATNDDGTPLFVTELLDTDLRSVLSQGPLLHEEIITLARDIAKALNYLHLNRPSPIIHRDISSANVLLWKRNGCWRGKLSDYGSANIMQAAMTEGPGASIYAAPEATTKKQSPKIDVYSFGILLCEMCTRELPVPEQKEEQIGLVTNRVLRELVYRCVQTTPESRPSMDVVITDLDDRRLTKKYKRRK